MVGRIANLCADIGLLQSVAIALSHNRLQYRDTPDGAQGHWYAISPGKEDAVGDVRDLAVALEPLALRHTPGHRNRNTVIKETAIRVRAQYSDHLEQVREYFASGDQPAGLRKAVSAELWAVLTVAAYLADE